MEHELAEQRSWNKAMLSNHEKKQLQVDIVRDYVNSSNEASTNRDALTQQLVCLTNSMNTLRFVNNFMEILQLTHFIKEGGSGGN